MRCCRRARRKLEREPPQGSCLSKSSGSCRASTAIGDPVSARFRIDRIRVDTDGGPVEYSFDGPLTVLSGPVGTGKSTLLELVKYALGGNARTTPVVDAHVMSVSLDVTLGRSSLTLQRPVASSSFNDRHGFVTVTDRTSRGRVGEYSAEPAQENSISAFLLEALQLPTDARASAQSRSTKTPPRITFNDIYPYLYVDQPEIDRSIVHHSDSYRAPKRRTAFELLFGISDVNLLKLRADAQVAAQEFDKARADEVRIRKFLGDVQTASREQAVLEQERVTLELQRSRATLQRLREEADPDDSRVDVARDLLSESRERLEIERRRLQEIDRDLEERRGVLASVRQEERRLNRMWDASRRLAAIEFVVCPRCNQSLKGRAHIPHDSCPLCLQTDTVQPMDDDASEADTYELRQLENQAEEIQALLAASTSERMDVEAHIGKLTDNIATLADEVDARTRDLVSPRLQAFADASARAAEAETRIEALEESLRLWDAVEDLSRATKTAKQSMDDLNSRIAEQSRALEASRQEFFADISETYQRTVSALGIPSVTRAHISSRNYLPVVDDIPFDEVSTGGIRTALIVAYWVTLLATAARDTSLDHPRLLIIDSPRKSIGADEDLAENLYRQLDILAQTYKSTVQIIVADNKLPSRHAKRWQEIFFDYETNPVLYAVPHPGPSKVRTLEGEQADEVEDT
ncbi:AAA family ATPase [Actinomycetospora lutea]|uniref:AAA family ATPase n=1 Tax=Actinomycetospora lutea TaxID=663604 RepID=UPI0023650E15|nr:AAA family ATPase [Actinomycetospora lutea]MDD7938679.1 AAA family ATPase [Actinomycetospora lutea]